MRVALFGLFVACFSSGCGSLLNQSPPGAMFNIDGERRPYRAFGGVRTDVELCSGTFGAVLRGEQSASRYLFLPLMLAVDLPLSAVTDTVLLPWDLRASIQWHRDGKPSPKVKPRPEPDPMVGVPGNSEPEARVPRFPYCIYFGTEAARIVVYSVFHTSRDPDIWKSRI